MIRTKETFFEHISNLDPSTQTAYKERISYFENWLSKSNFAINDLTDSWEDVLQLYVNSCAKKNKPRTVKAYFNSLRVYLHYMGYKITVEDIKESIRFPRVLEREDHPLQLDEIQAIFRFLDYQNQTFFLCQLSGGFRVGELAQLRKKDLVFGKNRIIVKIPNKIAKFKKARTTVISREASIKLTPMLRKLEDDDLIFGLSEKKVNAVHAMQTALRNACEKAELNQKYDDGNFKINTHSFRAYFITKVSRHDPNLAKKMTGQKGYLLQYDRLSDEEILTEYLKFEGDLAIYADSRKDQRIEQLEATIREKDELLKRVDKLEKMLCDDPKLKAQLIKSEFERLDRL